MRNSVERFQTISPVKDNKVTKVNNMSIKKRITSLIENMTFHYSSYCTSASRVPYVGRISVGKNDNIDFIYQFVKHTKHNHDHKWEDCFLTGTPTKFPNYGDFPRTYSMRNYGTDISISPWQDEASTDIPQIYIPQINQLKLPNYIDIEFHEAVYPIRVSVYEIYTPGNIIRIWAQDSDGKWCLLWNGSPQTVPPTSRLFSPPLQSCDFKTKSLRLEFKSSEWDYYTKLDAVMLIGTSKLIVSKNPEESLTDMLKRINCSMYFQQETEDVHNLTTDYENVHLDIVHLQENFSEYCIIRKSDIEKTFSKCNLDRQNISREVVPDYVQHFRQKYLHFRSKYNSNSAKRENLSSNGSMELSYFNFSRLPDEMILKVLKSLDFRALCRISQVNKRFNNLTRDYLLYTCLSVRCINGSATDMYNIFDYFTPRCKYLQRLDLTASEFSVSDFEKFLNNCGSCLTHLRLTKYYVDNDVLLKISNICKNLRKLDLRHCRHIQDKGYSYLENLECLEHLSFGFTFPKPIETQTLCKILQKNQQMRELHLEMMEVNLKTIALELRNSCRNLEVMNTTFCSYPLFRRDINHIIIALAACKNLRKIIFHTDPIFGNMFVDESLNILFSSCQRLEEVHLSGILNNLYLLTQCKNLKKLCLYKITSNKYSVILEQCPKLQELHLIDCKINKLLLNHWRERFPYVSVFVKTENYLRYQGEREYIDIDV